MDTISQAFALALGLIIGFDADLAEIVALSLQVSLIAVMISAVVGLSIGAFLAVTRFRGRLAVLTLVNALMGLPPVVIGLFVYLMLSRSGPLGVFGLLYTPTAMIIAQAILITPIFAALSRQVLEDMYLEYDEQLRSLNLTAWHSMGILLRDARFSLTTIALAALGRALSEVGAVMIVGGNIDHLTRVMTTAVALETSKGDLPLALALGMILLGLSLAINGLVTITKNRTQFVHG